MEYLLFTSFVSCIFLLGVLVGNNTATHEIKDRPACIFYDHKVYCEEKR
jgi:hypothetical protein